MIQQNLLISGEKCRRQQNSRCVSRCVIFINEETIGCKNEKAIGTINEAAISAIIAPRNPPSCCFISCFTVSVTPSINRPDFHSGSAVLTISSISSFKMNS